MSLKGVKNLDKTIINLTDLDTNPLFSEDLKAFIRDTPLPMVVYYVADGNYHAYLVSEGFAKLNDSTVEEEIVRLNSESRFVNIMEREELKDEVRKFTENDVPLNVVYHEYIGKARKLMTIHCYGVHRVTPDGRRYSLVRYEEFADSSGKILFEKKQKELAAEREQKMTILKGLSSEFLSVWYLDGHTQAITLMQNNGKPVDNGRAVKIGVRALDYKTAMESYFKEFASDEEYEKLIQKTSYEEIVKNSEENVLYPVNYVRKNDDGTKSYFQACYAKSVGKDGVVNFIFGFRNIDASMQEEKKRQEELEKAKDDAVKANRAKTEFLFNMSHDIRTPMNAIIGFINMALKNIDNKDKVKECLEKSQKSSEMLLNLINDVLEMSRIESGKIKMASYEADIYDSFYGIGDILKEVASSRDIELTFDYKNIQDRYIYCDVTHMNRIFSNIISNAIKYNHDGGYVKVTTEQVCREGRDTGIYRYTFEDNGIGMSEEFQKHVFEQFSREENSTVSRIQGTGLGLALCKELVDVLKGSIECESKQGQGSKFIVTVPFKINHSMQENGKKAKDKQKDVISFAGKKVLLVDDNDLNRDIAKDMLEDNDIIVDEADNGVAAVDMVKKNGPHYYSAILMDIQMPLMDGYEATKVIRETYPDAKIPIIALSANAFEEDKQRSIDMGMNAHVAKPVNIDILLKAMSEAVSK